MTIESTNPKRSFEVFGATRWLVIFGGHLIVAIAWYQLMPGGFPALSGRSLANRGLPVVIAAVAAAGFYARTKKNAALFRIVALTFLSTWCVATLTASIAFPVSVWRFGIAAYPAVAYLAFAFHRSFSKQLLLIKRAPAVLSIALGSAIGLAAPMTQRAGDPTTSPLNLSMALNESDSEPMEMFDPIRLGTNVLIRSRSGQVTVQSGERLMQIEPLLTFQSRSPDRFWTVFAPDDSRIGDRRELERLQAVSPSLVQIAYRGGERGILEVVREQDELTRITAWSQLDESVYSHLNTFCRFTVTGLSDPSVAFSPAADRHIAVTEAQYPVGKPMRLAYRSANDQFHVVQANSGEKGPFVDLATGRLESAGVLNLVLYDGAIPIWRVQFDDWAAQQSTSLSPTAGWGLPANAIEFELGRRGSKSAEFWITLAATSVGRGWDSVGHTAGTYRNRMVVEDLIQYRSHRKHTADQ